MNWLKNSQGNADAMLTFGAISLGCILVKFMFSEMSIGPIVFGQLDGSVIAAILTPTLGAYVARRYSDSKQETPNPTKEDDNASKT